MKILLVHDLDPFQIGGGVETNTRYLLTEFQRLGHEVALAYQHQFGKTMIADLETILINSLRDLTVAFKRFDCITLLGSMSLRPLFLTGSQILTKQERKFIVYFRATTLHRPFSNRIKGLINLEVEKLDNEMSEIIRSPYSVIVANSHAMKKDLLRMYPSGQSKNIYVAYPGTIWPKKAFRVKKATDKFVFINVGRLTLDKGVLFLWEAFYLLQGELSKNGYKRKVELHIIGDGELRERLRFLIDEFSLSGSVFLHGKKQHKKVFEYMANAHAMVHAAITEPFGNVIVEALGMDLPVIAPNHEGPKEILEDGKFGKLVPRANSWELKEAMKEILINEKSYEDLIIKARTSNVKSKYTITNQARALLEIINKELVKSNL